MITSKPKPQPLVTLPSGSHTGGSCQSCGKPVAYWITYRLCDGCIQIRPAAVVRP